MQQHQKQRTGQAYHQSKAADGNQARERVLHGPGHAHPAMQRSNLEDFPWSRDDMIAKVIESRKDGRFCTTKLHQGDAMYTNNVYERLLKVHPNPADFVLFYTILVSRKHIMSLEEIKYAVELIKNQLGFLRADPFAELSAYRSHTPDGAKRFSILKWHHERMVTCSTVLRYQLQDYYRLYQQVKENKIDPSKPTSWKGSHLELRLVLLALLSYIADFNRYALQMFQNAQSTDRTMFYHYDLAKESYSKAQYYTIGISPLDPLVLGLALNSSLFYLDVCGMMPTAPRKSYNRDREVADCINNAQGAFDRALVEFNRVLTDVTGNSKLPEHDTVTNFSALRHRLNNWVQSQSGPIMPSQQRTSR